MDVNFWLCVNDIFAFQFLHYAVDVRHSKSFISVFLLVHWISGLADSYALIYVAKMTEKVT